MKFSIVKPDILLLVLVLGLSVAGATPTVSTVYTPFHFAASEGWHLTSEGDSGESRLEGSRLLLDFTDSARWIGIVPSDRVILGMSLNSASASASTAWPRHSTPTADA